jgi:peptidoglycan/LPS O-acetylase OafA/YrhL
MAWAIAYFIVVRDLNLLSVGSRFLLSLSVLGRAPAFLVGIAASAIVSRHGATIRAAAHASPLLRRGGSDVLLLLALWGLGWLLREVTYRNFFQAEGGWTAWHVPESLLWGFVVLLVLLAPLRLRTLISNRAMVTMGMLSYSLYLIHHPTLHHAQRFTTDYAGKMPWLAQLDLQNDLINRSAAIVVALMLCTTLAAITYTLVERPFLVRKAKIGR